MTPLADPIAEARRIVEAATSVGLTIRLVGGVAVALVAPTIGRLDPPRAYHDIDLAAPPGATAIAGLMAGLGYGASTRFNALNGSERLLFHDPGGRRVDVFIDSMRMCHDLSFRGRLGAWPWTLPPADLLLSKLQIVESTDRDAQDVLALLADHDLTEAEDEGIDLRRIRDVCGNDWGWWRTVDDNLGRLIARWAEAPTSGSGPAGPGIPVDVQATAIERAVGLREALQRGPRSVGWRLRAMVGPRIRWYELPEEVR
jgi:hypothetical protein